MVQQVMVSTDATVALKPLIESAIRSELRVLRLGIDRTQQRLRAFEQQFGLNSAEFLSGFESGQIAESLDFIEWAGEIRTLELLQAQQRALQDAQLQ